MRGTSHLLAVMPHLLGYLPERSLVVVATRVDRSGGGVHRGAVAMSLRVDLPPAEHLWDMRQVLDGPLRSLTRGGGRMLLHTFVYDPPGVGADQGYDEGYVEQLLAALEEAALRTGTAVHDLDLVRAGGREHRRLLVATDRVDEPWRPAPSAADVPAAADLVWEGRTPAASRSEVVAAIRHQDESACAATDLALTMLAADPARLDQDQALAALGSWVVRGEPAPTAKDRAWIAVELHDKQVRDALLGRWLPQTFHLEELLDPPAAAAFRQHVPAWPADDSTAALDRLLRLASQIPRDLTAPLMTVASFVAWVTGQGTIANEACELALEVDPDYRMAGLLRDCLASGVRPPRADRETRRARDRARDRGRAA